MRCNTVAWRADAMLSQGKTRDVDQRVCGKAAQEDGPVEARLRSHDPVKGLVFEAWSEASPAVHALIATLSRTGAQRHQRHIQTATDEAQGALRWMLHRWWALTAARENTRLLLSLPGQVGTGAAAAQ